MGKSSSKRRFAVVDALNAEWDRLAVEQRDTIRGWAASHPELGSCEDGYGLIAQITASPDDVLRTLIMRCSAGEQFAGRAVLQAMLGKVVRLAVRDPAAGVENYVSAMWIRILTYPLADRPDRIAANLSLDTLKAVKQEARWLRQGEVTPYPPHVLMDQASHGWPYGHHQRSPGVSAGTVIAAARSLGLVDKVTGDVLASVYDEGLTGRLAAARHNTSPGMVRYRCSRAVRRLALHADFLIEAA